MQKIENLSEETLIHSLLKCTKSISSEVEPTDASNDLTPKQQDARAMLRASFLNSCCALMGKQCSILTFEKSSLKATFTGWNADASEILVENLKTPNHDTVAHALLRTPDILSLQFEQPLNSK